MSTIHRSAKSWFLSSSNNRVAPCGQVVHTRNPNLRTGIRKNQICPSNSPSTTSDLSGSDELSDSDETSSAKELSSSSPASSSLAISLPDETYDDDVPPDSPGTMDYTFRLRRLIAHLGKGEYPEMLLPGPGVPDDSWLVYEDRGMCAAIVLVTDSEAETEWLIRRYMASDSDRVAFAMTAGRARQFACAGRVRQFACA
jgi:hypothetical protein